MPARRDWRPLLALALLLLATGCIYTIDHRDVFVSSDAHRPVDQLTLPPGIDRTVVREIELSVDGRRFQGYRVASRQPARAVLFMTGNGYGAPAALARVAAHFHDERTDVYAVSYMQPSEDKPLVGQVFAMASALADHAAKSSVLPKEKVIAVGHSLGGWVTMHLASEDRVGCAVVVGSGTTARATAERILQPDYITKVLDLRASADVALLDNERLARKVRVPTLVVGSEADRMMPPSEARKIHDSLGDAGRRSLFVATSAPHEGYFRDASVLDAIRGFLRSHCVG